MSVSQGRFGLYWNRTFFHNPNSVVTTVCSSGLDERLKVTAAVPVVVSGVIAMFYGSDLIALQFYEAYRDEKVWKRPCRSLQSCFFSFIMEPPEVEHPNDTTD